MSKIQIITSIVGGILDDVTVRIGEKIVTDFEHLAFDWDVYEGEERASYQGNLEDCTEEEAKEHYNDLVAQRDDTDPEQLIAWCNDCKKDSIFEINVHQDPLYVDGKRQRECIKCGRYEPEKEDQS
jgi:hypothetical protein